MHSQQNRCYFSVKRNVGQFLQRVYVRFQQVDYDSNAVLMRRECTSVWRLPNGITSQHITQEILWQVL